MLRNLGALKNVSLFGYVFTFGLYKNQFERSVWLVVSCTSMKIILSVHSIFPTTDRNGYYY